MPEQPAAPAAEDTVTVHPGDILQITDSKHPGLGCVLIAEGCHKWGVGATLRWFAGERTMEAYIRLKPGQFSVTGAAAVLSPETLAARRASIETARLVAEEAGS